MTQNITVNLASANSGAKAVPARYTDPMAARAATTPPGHYSGICAEQRASRKAFQHDADYRAAVRAFKDRYPNIHDEDEADAHFAWLASLRHDAHKATRTPMTAETLARYAGRNTLDVAALDKETL